LGPLAVNGRSSEKKLGERQNRSTPWNSLRLASRIFIYERPKRGELGLQPGVVRNNKKALVPALKPQLFQP